MGKWMPVEEGEITRGLAAMIVFNGLHDYADCRLCRLVPDEGSVPVESIRICASYGMPLGITYAEYNAARDNVLAWLEQQKGSHDE